MCKLSIALPRFQRATLIAHIPAQYMNQSDIGLIGLAVMGENLVLNMESRGFRVSVFNRTTAVTEKFASGRAKRQEYRCHQDSRGIRPIPGAAAQGANHGQGGCARRRGDRPVGAAYWNPETSSSMEAIRFGPIRSGARRRSRRKGIHFFGVGVSGGEEGALKGPSIMPGGSKEGWQAIAPIYTKIAAVAEGEPCCRHMGPDGAGHYVKMVHNGIEYGDMQLICEAYAILKAAINPSADEFAQIFGDWNKGQLNSFLIEITAKIFKRKDPETGKPLVDVILDKAGQKGTGKWTVGHAVEMSRAAIGDRQRGRSADPEFAQGRAC